MATTVMPSAAARRASPAPIPEPAPVMTAMPWANASMSLVINSLSAREIFFEKGPGIGQHVAGARKKADPGGEAVDHAGIALRLDRDARVGELRCEAFGIVTRRIAFRGRDKCGREARMAGRAQR